VHKIGPAWRKPAVRLRQFLFAPRQLGSRRRGFGYSGQGKPNLRNGIDSESAACRHCALATAAHAWLAAKKTSDDFHNAQLGEDCAVARQGGPAEENPATQDPLIALRSGEAAMQIGAL
jgi:hypothetical protein